jgi:hypothetical protein
VKSTGFDGSKGRGQPEAAAKAWSRVTVWGCIDVVVVFDREIVETGARDVGLDWFASGVANAASLSLKTDSCEAADTALADTMTPSSVMISSEGVNAN